MAESRRSADSWAMDTTSDRPRALRLRRTRGGGVARLLASADGRVRAQVQTLEPPPGALVVFKVWIDDVCHHYVIQAATGAIVAEGRDGRERGSWQMARGMLVARGLVEAGAP